MPLTGQAKTEYQREYMRKRRSNARSNAEVVSVRPKADNVRPTMTRQAIRARIAKVRPSNGTEQDDTRAASDRLVAALGAPAIVPIDEPEPQSYNPMMVGYVPPKNE